MITTEETLLAIKRRAQKILEERKKEKQLKVSGRLSSSIGYESNPANTGTPHKGDPFVAQNVSLFFLKRINPTLYWQSTYFGQYNHYFEISDSIYTYHTWAPAKLRWRPGKMWRMEGWTHLDYLWYPESENSGYRQVRPGIEIRQNLFNSYYHEFQYEWLARDYIDKPARTGTGANTLTRRNDQRHRLRYEIGTVIKKALVSLRGDWYLHNSNDERNDFYDSEQFKITGIIRGKATDKLYLSGRYSYQRENYQHRPVAGINSEARYNDTHVLSGSMTYSFHENLSATYRLSYKFLDSNEPTGEYNDTTTSLAVTTKF